jgi:hypothetical protein
MLPKETKEMRDNFGLYNYSIYEESLRAHQRTKKVMANYMREFLDEQFQISSTTSLMLEEILPYLSDTEWIYINGDYSFAILSLSVQTLS